MRVVWTERWAPRRGGLRDRSSSVNGRKVLSREAYGHVCISKGLFWHFCVAQGAAWVRETSWKVRGGEGLYGKCGSRDRHGGTNLEIS